VDEGARRSEAFGDLLRSAAKRLERPAGKVCGQVFHKPPAFVVCPGVVQDQARILAGETAVELIHIHVVIDDMSNIQTIQSLGLAADPFSAGCPDDVIPPDGPALGPGQPEVCTGVGNLPLDGSQAVEEGDQGDPFRPVLDRMEVADDGEAVLLDMGCIERFPMHENDLIENEPQVAGKCRDSAGTPDGIEPRIMDDSQRNLGHLEFFPHSPDFKSEAPLPGERDARDTVLSQLGQFFEDFESFRRVRSDGIDEGCLAWLHGEGFAVERMVDSPLFKGA